MEQVHAVGKRKTAVARVWMRPGTGRIVINDREVEEYLGRETLIKVIHQPLEKAGALGRYDIRVNVAGGGISGQAEAICHGIAKALVAMDGDLRSLLKKAGFLTRDPRVKERKKYGQRGARARFQFSKR